MQKFQIPRKTILQIENHIFGDHFAAIYPDNVIRFRGSVTVLVLAKARPRTTSPISFRHFDQADSGSVKMNELEKEQTLARLK